MPGTPPSVDAAIGPLLAAKGRIPLLPRPHVPRPRPVGTLAMALRTHRLVLLSAGALTGKTTLLAELAGVEPADRVLWYSVDELDDTPRVMMEGLVRAIGELPTASDETHLLAQLVGALASVTGTTALILDDIHRSSIGVRVAARLLRYLPPRAHLLLSGHPHHEPDPALVRWLEDRGHVARVGAPDLRLDDEERARFHTETGCEGGWWAVGFRRGGVAAVVDDLGMGVLPGLDADLRAVIDLLCVLPAATPSVLGAALSITQTEAAARLATLHDETILLERLGNAYYRLGETARQAALRSLDEATLMVLRRRAASAVDPHDPAQAAHLFAQAGDAECAAASARRVSWWAWQRQQSLGLATAALLPPAALCHSGALALLAARSRLVEQGPRAAHALVWALRPTTYLDNIERLRLLAQCCVARGRLWSLGRCVVQLNALATTRDARLTSLERSYALATLGISYGLAGDDRAAVDALQHGLDLLPLADGDEFQSAYVRSLARRALAVIQRRLGNLTEAERLYDDVYQQAMDDGLPYVQIEVVNNRAVLLQQRGEHAQSAEMLRAALASPWSAERGLRVLLNASLAEALDALGDRVDAVRALRAALVDVDERDVYGLRGYLHATLGLLLAESGHADAAASEIALGGPTDHLVARLAHAVLRDPLGADARAAIEGVLTVVGNDRILGARTQAHLARVYALQGDRRRARKVADAVVNDRAYPLTPRDAAILGPRTHRVRSPHPVAPSATTASASIVVRFFGPPMLTVSGQPVGSAWWTRAKGRELLWYALAHGSAGFTREAACADLFPEMDAEVGGRALRNTLHELRKLLRARCGVEEILVDRGGWLHMAPAELGAPCEVDTETLDAWLTRLRAGEPDAVGNLSALLTGRYLADLHEDWTRPYRHYWEGEAVHALDLTAAHYERDGHPAAALACLQREMEFSPDDPTLLRRVMLLYHTLDDPGGIRAAYLSYRRVLREDLEADPDPSVVDLYQTLTRP